ncbi:MAG: ABC transporter ATP-binding protein, partial [Herbiconiux sp.]|nr:ABC transporter ATP-binding protein [Herbiconiux sp.]
GPVHSIGSAEARVPIVRWRDDTGVHERRTEQPAHVVAELSARTDGGEPHELEVVRPALEDVYLELVGAAEAEASGTADARPATSTEVTA